MPADTKIVRVVAPFTGGFRDRPTKPNQAVELTDALYPLAVACERGGWTTTGQGAVFGATNYRRTREVLLPDQTTPDILVAAAGKIGVATSGGRNGDATESTLLVAASLYSFGAVWQGEQIITVEDGESPVLRYGGNLNTLTVGTGTISFPGGRLVEGSGTTFSSNWIGAFLWINSEPTTFYRIVSVTSTTALSVDTEVDPAMSTASFSQAAGEWGIARFGLLGLRTVVTEVGAASFTSGSATVTGVGTKWNTATTPSGSGRPAFYAGGARSKVDDIGRYDTAPYPKMISSVGSDTSITAFEVVTGSATKTKYRVSRPAIGKVSCAYRNRLYLAGIPWFPRRLYISPPGWNASYPHNGETTAIGRENLMAFQEIGRPQDPGTLNSLMALPSGNLFIASEQDVYIGWGEYPAFSSEKIADYGCFGRGAYLAVDDGAWFAGREGVSEVRGNRAVSISDGHIDRTWRDLVDETVSAVQMAMHQDHLYVSVHTGSSNVIYVWHRSSRTWVGNWSLPTTITDLDSSRQAGLPDKLLMAYGNTAIGDLSSTVTDHKSTIAVTSNPGAFKGVTPFDVCGDLSREREVKYAKVSYQLVGSGGPVLNASPGPSAPAVHTALAATTGATVATKALYPKSDTALTGSQLGVRVNKADLTLQRSGGTVTKLAIHELEFLVKEYRYRV